MLEGPFALAFGAGMVATINPCGFAMLPAYLSYFLGSEDRDHAGRSASDPGLGRAAVVGLSVTAGFIVVFGALFTQVALHPPVWVVAAIWLPLTAVIGLALMRPFKGAMIGLQIRNRASEIRNDDF